MKPVAKPVVIAVIDSGFDLQHPALNFVDAASHIDVRIYLRGMQQRGGLKPTLVQRHYAGPTRIPHGTAVAGVAAARPFLAPADGRWYQGVAPGFPVLPIRVSTRPSSGEIAFGINWAVAHEARVVCLSLRTTQTATLDAAITQATDRGVAIVAAAGNYTKKFPSRQVDYPAMHPAVLAVGAADRHGRRKRIGALLGEDWGSQYGRGLDVLAQGVDVPTIDERGRRGYVPGDVNLQSIGTSVAAPQVAGLVARLFAAQPHWAVLDAFRHVVATCDRPRPFRVQRLLEGRFPWNEEMGHGIVNVQRALETLSK